MDATRRKLLLTTMFGAGGLGLRALATGIPAGVLATLLDPRTAKAAEPAADACTNPQYIFFCTSDGGDPLNANVPGCYTGEVYHGPRAEVQGVSMTMGGKQVTGAAAWNSLGDTILARTSFLHHATYTNSHGDGAKVNRLMGAVARQEMAISLFAKHLQPCFGTIQAQPMVLANNLITFSGSVQPVLSPQALAAVLAAPASPLLDLQKIRDKHVDQLNALFKQSGTQAQRAILDTYANSQQQARSLSQDLLADLGSIRGSSRQDQNTAAAALFKMNVSPVAVGRYGFGGDNHGDQALNGETNELIASVAGIQDLMTKLTKYGLQDKVTIAFQNVFGRSLKISAHENNIDGRNHNSNHHATVLIGANVKSSVIGGVKQTSNGYDYQATGIDSASGNSNEAGDIPFNDTFSSVGKTFGRAVGVAQAVLDDAVGGINQGKVITAAVK